MLPHPTRRTFCTTTAALVATQLLPSHVLGQTDAPTRPDVAAIEHDRILRAADTYLADQPATVTSLPSPRSPGTPHDYFSEAPAQPDSDADALTQKGIFTAHRDAIFSLGLRVPALAAAYHLTGDSKYAQAAAGHLRAWFLDLNTRLNPSLDYAQVPSPATASTPETKSRTGAYTGIIETLPLVEIVQSISFLLSSAALTPSELAGLRQWFADYLHWLTVVQDSGARLSALARDSKDHHATSWMLQVSAFTLFTVKDTGGPRNEDRSVTELRRRFRSVTLRTQVSPEGLFRNELSTPNPYRNSLFNLDMLACLCQLLSTRFESTWDYELEDGPSMRVAVAYHVPFIQNRAKWPFRADIRFFDVLPSRRPALLFAARVYQRPEYATLWKSLQPDPTPAEIERTLPIHQPLLWTAQPRRATQT